jgi:putative addiction module killer protein
MDIHYYCKEGGKSPFLAWYDRLDVSAAARVATALTRLGLGNFSNVASVGQGVNELKIHFGPGYRVYFAHDGKEMILLLGGGSKQRQQRDINAAQANWKDYKLRKIKSSPETSI